MVKMTLRAVAAFSLGLILGCCGQAIAEFSYRYYNVKAESYAGTLEGKTPQDDISFEECKPRPGKQNPCTVVLSPEFSKLKSNYQKLEIDLKECRAQLNEAQNR